MSTEQSAPIPSRGRTSVDYRYAWRWGWSWIGSYLWRGRLLAALRQVWNVLVNGFIGEGCADCGRPYVLWWAPDDVWADFSGNAGLLCPNCFDARARKAGEQLLWRPVRATKRTLGEILDQSGDTFTNTTGARS